jgi:hypothetical protein
MIERRRRFCRRDFLLDMPIGPPRFLLVNLPFAVRILKRVGIERWKLEEEVSEKNRFPSPQVSRNGA